jgi:hypothetical protein
MRTTIDIPDPIYRGLKTKAASEGTTVRAIIMRLVSDELEGVARPASTDRVEFPLIRSKRKDKMSLTSEQLDEIAFG